MREREGEKDKRRKCVDIVRTCGKGSEMLTAEEQGVSSYHVAYTLSLTINPRPNSVPQNGVLMPGETGRQSGLEQSFSNLTVHPQHLGMFTEHSHSDSTVPG